MEFKEIKTSVQNNFVQMESNGNPIFQANIDKDYIWELYLKSFPAGTDPIFRERTEHDCACCRSFIKHAGGMVQVVEGRLESLWRSPDLTGPYAIVTTALADYVESCEIENIYLHGDRQVGLNQNKELLPDDKIATWTHFHAVLPDRLHGKRADIPSLKSNFKSTYDVCLRALEDITLNSLEVVLDLIKQGSLYRGSEKERLVETFLNMKKRFMVDSVNKSQFAWLAVAGPNNWACKIRSDVIGTLLTDLSEGMDLEVAVKRYEDKVSGTNYKRPVALITPKMKLAAQAKLEELGLMTALNRRYATLEDIKITDLLFANRTTKAKLNKTVFDDLPTKASLKSFDTVEEIGVEDFIKNVLPTATELEVLVENTHAGNFVSLIAPEDPTTKGLFKWNNLFSWSYTGDVADSIKERVKAAGGNVTGDVCCRLAWYNYDDLDLHMKEPNGYYISYRQKHSRLTLGELDVDMNGGGGTTKTPVENIFYSSVYSMVPGIYKLKVNQYARREYVDVGFDVDIEVLGTKYSFNYPKAVSRGETIEVATLEVDANHNVKVVPVLPANQSVASKQIWGLNTQEFVKVNAMMLSPNFWGDKSTGNKHYFFMLNNCVNTETARGFYNEFLHNDLEPHRKTMELVGSRMRTDNSNAQLSGLGFSSTKRASLVVKVQGSFTRTLKVIF